MWLSSGPGRGLRPTAGIDHYVDIREPDQYRLQGQDTLTDPGHHLSALYDDHVCPGAESTEPTSCPLGQSYGPG
jgi:hypothetical protein